MYNFVHCYFPIFVHSYSIINNYFYGSKINEILFRKVAHYLKKNYQNTTTICLKGKGHCEDALINPEEHIKTLNKVLKK